MPGYTRVNNSARNCVRKLGTTRREERRERPSGAVPETGRNGNLARIVSYFSLRSPYIERITPLRSTVISPRRLYLRRPVTDEDPFRTQAIAIPDKDVRPSPLSYLFAYHYVPCTRLLFETPAIHRFLLLVEFYFRDFCQGRVEFLRMMSSNGKHGGKFK